MKNLSQERKRLIEEADLAFEQDDTMDALADRIRSLMKLKDVKEFLKQNGEHEEE